MSAKRERHLRKLACEQIANAIQCDLDGDESLMKEVFEEVNDDDEMAIVNGEMRAAIAWLRARAKGITS